MSLFFYLFTFAINLSHRKLVTKDVTAVFVNNQHSIQRRGQDFDKSLYFKGFTAKTLTDEFTEKSWTKSGVNKLLKKLWNGQAAADRAVKRKWLCLRMLNILIILLTHKCTQHTQLHT